MAITYIRSISDERQSGPPYTLTIANWQLSGTDRMCVASCSSENATDMSDVTIDGNSMQDANIYTAQGALSLDTWYDGEAGLPGNGTYDVVFTGTVNTAGFVGGLVLLNGVEDQAPEATNTGSDSSNSTYNMAVSTVTDNAGVVSSATIRQSTTHVYDADMTERVDQNGGDGQTLAMGTYIAGAAVESVDTDGTFSNTRELVFNAVVFEEAAGGGGTTRQYRLTLLGVS